MSNDSHTETLVIEFEGNFDLDSIAGKQLQLIGIDKDEPILKLDSKFYKIDIKDSIGSRLIFDKSTDGKLKYCAKTDKAVTARRVMLKPIILGASAVLALFLILSSSPLSLATKYNVCELSKSLAVIKDVTVSDCESSTEVCPFIRGFNKSIELDFVPRQKLESVKVKVAGKLSALPIPFHINPDQACGNYGFDCPLEADKAYKFRMTMPILRTYPKLNVDVILKLLDEQGELIGCVELPAKIQEPQKAEVQV